MKKLLLLGAIGGGVYSMLNKRKKASAAEAKLWDEATGRTTPANSSAATGTATPASGTAPAL